jgi:excisionase family DNA binding protein
MKKPMANKLRVQNNIDLLTKEEAAKALKISAPTLMKFVRERELHGYLIGKQWRFDRSAVQAFLELRSTRKLAKTG